jgi:Tol biopolymer transport system component
MSTHENWILRRAQDPSTGEFWWPVAWFPDGNHLLANSAQTTHEGLKLATWVVSTHSGTAVKLRDDCLAHSISPDGSRIAFTAGAPSYLEEIWVMGAQGEAARKIVASQESEGEDAFFSSLRWSPDGRRIAFRREETFTSRVTVASVALEGGPPVPLVSDAIHWGDFCWMPNGDLLFSVGEKDDWDNMNLWELRPDPKSGASFENPRRLTDWTDFRIEDLSLSRDGTRLTFNKTSSQTSVLVAHLNAKGLTETPRRLTLDDYSTSPLTWASDSKTLFFSSERASSFWILKQKVNENQANQVVTQRSPIGPGRLTPDVSSLLYLEYPGTTTRLMIVPASGGLPHEFEFNPKGLIDNEIDNVDCAKKPATNCVAGTFDRPHHQHTFWNFDPSQPKLRRLFTIDYDLRKGFGWTVSPDGTRIATNKNYADHAEIEIYSLNGRIERRVRVNGFNHSFSVDWASDSLSWFVAVGTATGCSLLRVFQDGHDQVLMTIRNRGSAYTFGLPSPDGKELAIHGESFGGNVWMVDRINELVTVR